MTYSGHVQDGVIVLDGQPALPDGALVRVEVVGPFVETTDSEPGRTLGEVLLRFAGLAEGLPPDASSNHDAYLLDQPE